MKEWLLIGPLALVLVVIDGGGAGADATRGRLLDCAVVAAVVVAAKIGARIGAATAGAGARGAKVGMDGRCCCCAC